MIAHCHVLYKFLHNWRQYIFFLKTIKAYYKHKGKSNIPQQYSMIVFFYFCNFLIIFTNIFLYFFACLFFYSEFIFEIEQQRMLHVMATMMIWKKKKSIKIYVQFKEPVVIRYYYFACLKFCFHRFLVLILKKKIKIN